MQSSGCPHGPSHIHICGQGHAGFTQLLWSPQAANLLLLPPLGSLILEPDLHPSFWEVDPGCQLAADVNVWVVGKVEDLLQLMQLLGGEGGSNPPLALPPFCMGEGPSWVSGLDVST